MTSEKRETNQKLKFDVDFSGKWLIAGDMVRVVSLLSGRFLHAMCRMEIYLSLIHTTNRTKTFPATTKIV